MSKKPILIIIGCGIPPSVIYRISKNHHDHIILTADDEIKAHKLAEEHGLKFNIPESKRNSFEEIIRKTSIEANKLAYQKESDFNYSNPWPAPSHSKYRPHLKYKKK